MKKRVRYWYSEKQANFRNWCPEARRVSELLEAFRILHGLPEERETRCFVTLPVDGELVECQYTECYSGDNPNYWPNWDDAVFLGESEDYAGVRIEYVTEAK